MQDIFPLSFGLCLFVVAVWLVRRQLQVRQWLRGENADDHSPLEARFNTAQYRRRIQCSVILALLSIGVMTVPWIAHPVAQVVFGAAMLILLGWMILLAMLDIFATTTHYRRMANRYQNEQIRLQAKVRKILNEGEEEK